MRPEFRNILETYGQIAKDEIGPVGGLAASLAILFIIIVALAGLGLAVVNALAHSPWGTFTIGLTIPIALLMGFYLYRIRPGKVGEVSAIGFVLLLAAVFFGNYVPGSFLAPVFDLTKGQLVLSIALYGFIASVLPVWMLLCPRDYLSTYMKIGTVVLLALGVFSIAPDIQMPAVTRFVDGGGPIIPGTLFPFMFITIACGAISGFHSLISSGTTPKMINSEADIRVIGFGAMLVEGFVAMMALIAATVLIPATTSRSTRSSRQASSRRSGSRSPGSRNCPDWSGRTWRAGRAARSRWPWGWPRSSPASRA